ARWSEESIACNSGPPVSCLLYSFEWSSVTLARFRTRCEVVHMLSIFVLDLLLCHFLGSNYHAVGGNSSLVLSLVGDSVYIDEWIRLDSSSSLALG
ncbi:hypothetical protein AVEN_18004-1, partial [Araneus ventricosus]